MTDPAHYSAQLHVDDILAVADACQCEQFLYWGWSFGGTIGCNLTAQSTRVTKAVICGTYFGEVFTDSGIQQWLDRAESVAKLKAEGRLDELDEQQRAFAERTNFPVLLARIRSLPDWPAIQPDDIPCPTLVYSGTNDGDVYRTLQEQRSVIEAAGKTLHMFQNLDHVQLVSATDVIMPIVINFLKQ